MRATSAGIRHVAHKTELVGRPHPNFRDYDLEIFDDYVRRVGPTANPFMMKV